MSYTNNGYSRRKTLTITKTGYSIEYVITDAFTDPSNVSYAALTDTEFAQLSDADYNTRLTSFIAHVYAVETGLEDDCPDLTIGAQTYNTTLCPLS